jgi:hypothetical protein
MFMRLLVSSFLLVCLLHGHAQVRRGDEQSTFAVEEIPGEARVTHPIAVPDGVLAILRTDGAVKSCLKDNPLGRGQSLSSWFVASQIHLYGVNEADVIVLPSLHGEESMCFQSPTGVGLFWVFRHDGQQYKLVLQTWGNGLQILTSKTDGYRNIQTGTVGEAGRVITNVRFRFDGTQYAKDRETTSEQQ